MRWIYIFCAVAVILVGCGETKTHYPQPPMYPFASDIMVIRRHMAERVVTFQTLDPPKNVHTFFRDQLLQEGWKVHYFREDYSSYRYSSPDYDYGLELSTTTDSGITFAQIRFVFSGPGLSFPDEYTFPPVYK